MIASRLKVLFVIDSLGTGGAERDLAEQLPHLERFDIAPIVVSLRPREEGVQAELQRQGFDVRILSSTGIIGRLRALHRIVKAERPDIVHTVLFKADILGRVAALGTSATVVSRLANTDYDIIRLRDPNIRARRLRLAQLLDGWTARHLAHHIYANSEAVRTAAVRDLHLTPERVTVLKGGRDAVRLGHPGSERRKQARAMLGLEAHQDVLVTVGRQDFQKGQQYLLRAMATLVETRPRLVLLIVGRAGDASGELEGLREKLGLRNHVQLLGHREDVPEILAAADLFVFPTLYEGLPGAVVEAMALGLPIVATDIDPVREAVEEGRNALLVPREDHVELAVAIGRLLRDRATAAAFGKRSRAIFDERFTLDRSLSRLSSYLRQIAGRS